MRFTLTDFVAESNRIEGIHGMPPTSDIEAHKAFLALDTVCWQDVEIFVSEIQPGAVLRDQAGLDVFVGQHIPPAGGHEIKRRLDEMLNNINIADPFYFHCDYECLHPFTDGNGRSGRLLWLYRMGGIDKTPLGFLHHFYYQTLAKAA